MAQLGRRLILRAEHAASMWQHAETQRPEECCGILIGRLASDRSEIEEVVPADNVAADPLRRYDIDPRQLLDAHRRVRDSGQDIVGYFHSHPSSEPRPSPTDRRHAWPQTSYVILGVDPDQRRVLRSWRLLGVEDEFVEEELVIR